MISMKTLIVEGRYDALVTKLSRELLAIVKLSHIAVNDPRGQFAGKQIYFKDNAPAIESADYPEIYFREIENEEIPAEFYLTLKIQWVDDLPGGLRKGGDAFNDTEDHITDDGAPPLIEIRLELDSKLYPNILSDVAMALRDTLRHEIEHITQSGWNLKQGKYLRSDQHLRKKIAAGDLPAYRYFTLPKEVDANLQGLYLQAKKSRRPFAQVVNQYLDSFVPQHLSDTDKEIVLKVWRKRIPALGIKQEL